MSKELGFALRQARRELHLTQEQIAKQLGVSRAAVGQWENGEDPSTDNLLRICDRLGIEVQAAIEGQIKHKEGFKAVDKKPDYLGNIDSKRKPLPIEQYPFNQENYFIKTDKIPYYPIHDWKEGYKAITQSPPFFAPRPENLPAINSLYMAGIVSSPLEPIIRSMSMFYADSEAIASIGDIVIVRILQADEDDSYATAVKVHPSQMCVIGYLEKFNQLSIVMRQTSPEREIWLGLDQIASIHPVLPPDNF